MAGKSTRVIDGDSGEVIDEAQGDSLEPRVPSLAERILDAAKSNPWLALGVGVVLGGAALLDSLPAKPKRRRRRRR